ncbi:MAG: dTMP kinase [Dehalococcoidia bacterium]
MSLFISFEGGEGSGKTTQAEILAERLRAAGFSVLPVHEPGTTPLGNYLRIWLRREYRKEEAVSHDAELLLFAAARAELVAKGIKPALQQNRMVVIADRYADSTTAYQGYGRRIRLEYVKVVNSLATQGVIPDLTLLLDCPPEEGLKRVQSKLPLEPAQPRLVSRMDEEGTRRFEEETRDFHERVHRGYLKLAQQEPDRWRVIDATKSIDEISDTVWRHVQQLLARDLPEDAPDLNFKSSPQGRLKRGPRRSKPS